MAVQSSLYSGFVRGKANAIKLGPNNPQIDNSYAQKDASAKLAAHVGPGTRPHKKVDGPAQRVTSQPGRKTGSKMNIKGGTF